MRFLSFAPKLAWSAALVFLSTTIGPAQTAGTTSLSKSSTGNLTPDRTAAFLKQTARNNDMEIALTEVGARKARNPQLKQYCLQLEREKIQTDKQLKPIAQQHAISIDRPLTRRDEKELARLEHISGTKFDRGLAGLLLREQQRNVAGLEQASAQVPASDARQYAQQALPKARQELAQVQAAAHDVGVKRATPAQPAAAEGTSAKVP